MKKLALLPSFVVLATRGLIGQPEKKVDMDWVWGVFSFLISPES